MSGFKTPSSSCSKGLGEFWSQMQKQPKLDDKIFDLDRALLHGHKVAYHKAEKYIFMFLFAKVTIISFIYKMIRFHRLHGYHHQLTC